MPVVDYINSFYNFLQYEKRYSPHTVTSYRHDIEQFTIFLAKVYEINELHLASHTHIRSWLVQLMGDKMTGRSINRKISALKTFYKFLLRNNITKQNPTTKVISPKISKRLPVFVEEKSIEKMLHPTEIKDRNPYTFLRDGVILELFYATGMRVSELTNLKTSDVNFYQLNVKVLGKGNKERLIPLEVSVIDAVKMYMDIRNKTFPATTHDAMFLTDKGDKIYVKAVQRMVKKALTEVTTTEKKSPHVLRHTFATHLLNHGAEINAIKELLGHASLSATQVYTHNSIDKLKNIYKKAHPKA